MPFNYDIISPAHSFVKFNSPETADDCCKDDSTFCLPLFSITDLRFQFKIIAATEADADAIFALEPGKLQLTLHDGISGGTELKNFTVTDNLYFNKIRMSATEILCIWTNELTGLLALVACKKCFQLGITLLEEDVEDEEIFYSNCFVRICDDCFTSVLEYYNDDDFAGFRYCNTYGFANRVRLPFYFYQPQYPEDEQVYIRSNGYRKVLKLNVIKEYSAITEHMPEHLHDKLKIALSHDVTTITGEKYSGGFRKSSAYAPEWTEDLCLSPATFKALVNPDVSKNGNCQTCEDVPAGCAQINAMDTETGIDPPDEWIAVINSFSFLATPAPPNNQYIDIFYRQGGSTGAFTLAGNVTVNSTGTIISSPDPFPIGPLSDTWGSIEVKAVNQCGGSPFYVTLYNPCQTLAGLIGESTDGGTDWGVDITDVVYSVWPQFGVHKTLDIFYREYGSGSGWTSAGSIDVVVAAGFVVTITPDPFQITGLSADWDKVEIKTEYDCERQLLQVFSNPLDGCLAVTVVTVDSVTATDVNLRWPRVLPTPPGGYDWELWDYGMTGMIQSGNTSGPGGTIFLYIDSLTTATHYNFRVRAVCDGPTYSIWTNQDFTTS